MMNSIRYGRPLLRAGAALWWSAATALWTISLFSASPAAQDLAVQGRIIHTMASGEAPIVDGVVVLRNGKIVAVGPRDSVEVPEGMQLIEAAVVTPGLVDAHSVVGLAGYLNYAHDQDQLEESAPVQPELRAVDAYNPREPLVEYLRGFGITTVHTGHAPAAVISGQTMIVKTVGTTVDEATLVPFAMLSATLGEEALRDGDVPGTRSKAVALLRQSLLEARAYVAKGEDEEARATRETNLRHEALAAVLSGEVPLMVTAQRASDILTALRIASEFEIRIVLDGVAEIYDVAEPVRAAGIDVILHPTMQRAVGERRNLSLETAAKMADLGIRFALQSGFESYVPKTRVVLFEAAIAAANGLGFERALASITIDAAGLLGVADRVGSIEVGKDADLALYDGDPFQYTSHCIGVVIDGVRVSDRVR